MITNELVTEIAVKRALRFPNSFFISLRNDSMPDERPRATTESRTQSPPSVD